MEDKETLFEVSQYTTFELSDNQLADIRKVEALTGYVDIEDIFENALKAYLAQFANANGDIAPIKATYVDDAGEQEEEVWVLDNCFMFGLPMYKIYVPNHGILKVPKHNIILE